MKSVIGFLIAFLSLISAAACEDRSKLTQKEQEEIADLLYVQEKCKGLQFQERRDCEQKHVMDWECARRLREYGRAQDIDNVCRGYPSTPRR